jgi:progressive ankylosis protein
MTIHADGMKSLTVRRILQFWLPLEATWLMMAVEGPFLAAVIARLPGPKENLAAFGVAAALAWIVESPIIMMLSASNALCRDRIAYRKLRRFSFTLNGVVTVVMLTLIAPPVFGFVVRGIMGLPPDVAGLAGRSILFLALWPAAIGFRRFYQGILIRSGRPQAVTWGTVIRLSTMTVTGLFLALIAKLPGASVGAGAMGAGVIAEGAASWAMARSTLQALRRQPDEFCEFGRGLTFAQIRRFYAPLALTSFLSFFINPLTSFFMARGRQPIESLAILPVIIGLAFIFRTAGISLQEVVIALIGDAAEHREALARFSKRVAAVSTLALAAVVFTPLAAIWYHAVSGLSSELSAFALLPGALLVLLPLLETTQSYQRAVLVKSHRTGPIGAAVTIQLALTTATFIVTVFFFHVPGAATAGIALTAGYAAGNVALYVLRGKRRILRNS